MRRQSTLVLLSLALVLPLHAGSGRAAVPDQRPIEVADIMAWRGMMRGSGVVSEDGMWFGYLVGPAAEGDADVVIRQTRGEQQFTFGIGETPGRGAPPVFSPDGRFAVVTIYPTRQEAAQLRAQRRPLQTRVGIVTLATGRKIEVPKVRRFALSGENGAWIAMHRYGPDPAGGAAPAPLGRAPAGSAGPATDLLLRELATGQQLSIGNVADFAFDRKGRYLAWTIDAQDKVGNGVQMRDMETGAIRSIESDDTAVFSRMSWTEDGDALSMLKFAAGRVSGDLQYVVVGYKGFSKGAPQRVMFNPEASPEFPAGMSVSPNRSPSWTTDQSALLFGIAKAAPADARVAPATPPTRDRSAPRPDPRAAAGASDATAPTEEKVDLKIWHWRDPRLQSQQVAQATFDRNFSYLAAYRAADRKFIRLADDQVRDVVPAPDQKFAIGRDRSAYALMASLDGRHYEDLYAIDMATGARTLAVKKAQWTPVTPPPIGSRLSPSPTGTHFLYFEDGHFYAYDMTSGQSTNITKGAPVAFVDIEDDHPVEKPPTVSLGWSTDGQSVLLTDNWDIWQVPVSGGTATNLTVNGKKDQIRYRQPQALDPDERGRDLSKPLYVSMYGEWTKKSGIGVIMPGVPGVKRLLWDDAMYSAPLLTKARKADVYLYMRETYKEPPDVYVTDASLANGRRITNLAAGTEQFLWSSGSMLVDYVSAKGDKLQGALYLPANYEKGKSYPTVVAIYEQLSSWLHVYDRHTRATETGFPKSMYTSQGYAVFSPDITYKMNDPGMSAVWCMLPAVKAAIATGVVDPKRIGLTGHSWGGYQTDFLIGQTDIFAAAVAGAGFTDLIGMYGGTYKLSGVANSTMFESGQGRMTSGPLENLAAYTRNSPVFFAKNVKTPLLMLHNDQDNAVDFSQGLEFFNTLRRLQKPVVLLEYPGETHGLAKRVNWKDYQTRVQEFFDHYLMGKPMPKWYAEGVPYLEMEEHLKGRGQRAEGRGKD